MKSMFSSVLSAAALAAVSLGAQATVYQFNASLNSANEVGGTSSATATGLATLSYDDKGTLSLADDSYNFAMSVFGLSGGGGSLAATAFHIHGSATTTENAPVRVGLDNPSFFTFLNSGSTLLVGGSNVAPPASIPATGVHPSMSFLAMLQDGLAYVNVHTLANPGGAVRGQLIPVAVVPEPTSYAMLLAGLGAVFLISRRRQR